MAGRASDALCDVDRVIEIDVAWQSIHLIPVNGTILGEALADRRKHRRLRVKLGVACHAGVGRRNASDGRRLHAGVTVTAVETEATDMMCVAERYGLIESDLFAGHMFGSRYPISQTDCEKWNDDDEYENTARNRIR
jgi:hypothetical protein